MDQETIEQGAHTPDLRGQGTLDPSLSRYVEVSDLPWKPTQSAGIEIKILLQDKKTGLMTALFRWQAGARLAMHEHVEIEQSYVLSGSIVDDEGEATAGNYVWRPKGHRHYAVSPNGAVVLCMFLRPNVFLEEEAGKPQA